MCFFKSTASGETEELIAEDDIPCIKIYEMNSNGDMYSPYQTHVVEIGKSYTSSDFGDTTVYDSSPGIETISYGFHSFHLDNPGSIEQMIQHSGRYAYECVIPKGTKYYTNTSHGEYVSESIRIGEHSKTYEKAEQEANHPVTTLSDVEDDWFNDDWMDDIDYFDDTYHD